MEKDENDNDCAGGIIDGDYDVADDEVVVVVFAYAVCDLVFKTVNKFFRNSEVITKEKILPVSIQY